MNTQDETIIREGKNGVKTAAEPTTNGKKNAAQWQTLSIGGVVGIALGMAATHATDAFASTEAEEVGNDNQTAATEESSVATEIHQASVDQGQSFSEAFAAARAEVGPGGVFLWHGGLYGTYTADEWQAMSDAQKDEFAHNVQPLLGQQTVETQRVVHQTVHRHEEEETHVHISGNQTDTQLEEEEQELQNEPEVHFLGVDTEEINGHTMNFGMMSVDGVNVALVDMDNNQVFDVRVIDENQNGKIEDEEMVDISDRGLTVEEFQTLSMLDEMASLSNQMEQANNVQEDLAPDMPDYMNDADLGTI
ncbi:MAG: hypothetical protein K6D37_05500 [Prevotella sp.]|nr:hypothetical protein [Prevotella sp.]